MRLKDRVAIVTGAARGIGRAIALGFAREGGRVVACDRRADGLLTSLVEEIAAGGGEGLALEADVTNAADHERIVSSAVERFGRLDILVNNAGIEIREPFLEASSESWERILNTNLRGPYFLARHAAQAMIQSGGGKIINLSSVHDTVPLRERSIYSISKGGMSMLVKTLAMELAEHRINVNAISPGAVLTDMNRQSLSDPVRRAKVLERIPLGRFGAPEDIVGAAVFLASAESDYVTGATLYVDGGLLLQK